MAEHIDIAQLEKREPVIRRATLADAQAVNAWIARDSGQEADFTPFLECDLNVCLLSGNGGALFAWRGPGIYEAHAFFEQRGAAVRDISLTMLRMMFALHGARMIWSAVPTEHKAARLYCRWVGFRHVGFADFPHGRCEILSMETPPCLR